MKRRISVVVFVAIMILLVMAPLFLTSRADTLAIFRVTMVESELAGPPVWVIAPSDQVLAYGEHFDYALVVMSPAGIETWWLNNTWDFEEIIPQHYDRGSTARIRNKTVLAPGDYGLWVVVTDVNGDTLSGIFRVTVTRQLRLKLSGSFDYLLKEEIQLQLAGLLTDTFTGEPVSGATVTFDIYNPDGSLLVSGTLLEHTKPGVYIYTMPDTMKDLKLPKGIYLVYAHATSPGGFDAVDMIQFHIDPPPGLELNALANTAIGMIALTAIGLVGVFIWRRKLRSLELGS